MARYLTTNKWEDEKKSFSFKLLKVVGSDGLDIMRSIEKHPKGVTLQQIIEDTGLKRKTVEKELKGARRHRLVKLIAERANIEAGTKKSKPGTQRVALPRSKPPRITPKTPRLK